VTVEFYTEILGKVKERVYNRKEFARLKRDLAKKYTLPKIPTNIDILMRAPLDQMPFYRSRLLTKPVRSMSGVSPVAIMTKPIACPHGKCTMCPGGPNSSFGDVPMSYTGKEPSTMRAMRNDYDSYLITFNRLEQFALLGHNFDKVEFIIMGGTFPAFPEAYQEEVVMYAFKALNDFSDTFFDGGVFNWKRFKDFFELPIDNFNDAERVARIKQKLYELKGDSTLEAEHDRNETSMIRCVALCVETKPDWGLQKHGDEMLRLGCTRVELGVQSVYEDVIKHIHRGHTIQDTKDSLRILRDQGFKVAAHYMPGLPLTDYDRDVAGLHELWDNPDYRPDMLKLYPCMVSKGTALYYEYERGDFKPMDAKTAAKMLAEWKPSVPKYCRIMRIQRDVPTKQWAAGVEMTNFRQYLFETYNPVCHCIRCREPMGRTIDWDNVQLHKEVYEASSGTELFLSMVDTTNDILIGFVRMRYPSENLRSEFTLNSAIIRELHVYGTATAIGGEGAVQHKGMGKTLMHAAETLAREDGKNKLLVISGVGVRPYYYKLGYQRDGPYVSKHL